MQACLLIRVQKIKIKEQNINGKKKEYNRSTFQVFDMDPQQAQVLHQSRESSGHWGKAYAVEASEPDKGITCVKSF